MMDTDNQDFNEEVQSQNTLGEEVEGARKKRKRKRVLIGAIFLLLAGATFFLFYTGNPLIYRVIRVITDPWVVAGVIFCLFYYLWYTHRLDRVFVRGGVGETVNDQPSRFRKINASIFGGIGTALSFLRRVIAVSLRFVLSPVTKYIHAFPHNRKVRRSTYAFVGLLIILFVGLEIWKITRPIYLSPRDLEDNYTLVRDMVPADGPIIVRLPDGVDKSWARLSVRFEPDLDVGYARTLSDRHIAFRLKEELLVGDRYTVYFEQDGKESQGVVFKAVLRPKVESFQPDTELVTDEYSSISFSFNRAMIPLESLDREYRPESFPVTITPETEGVFKWESPRQLQFIPDTHLIRAATYTVTIGDGFYSSDGLQVPPQEYAFRVKPLVLTQGLRRGTVSYKHPVTISLNQPVDLSKSKISLFKIEDTVNKVPLAVEVDHPSRVSYNPENNTKERIVDRSKILITPKQDEMGRQGFWDFGSRFEYEIDGLYSLNGDLNIDRVTEGSFTTRKLISGVHTKSTYSTYITENLFDPRGTLTYVFEEEIDIADTIVKGKGITKTSYRLDDDCSNRESYDDPCRKVENKKTLQVHFDPIVLDKGEQFTVTLSTIVGIDGEVFSNEPYEVQLRTVPDLTVSKLMPIGGVEKASLSSMFICSNVPLAQVPDDEMDQHVQSYPAVTVSSWGRSQLVNKSPERDTNYSCAQGEYKTEITYSLEQKTLYSIALILKDQFGGEVEKSVSFKTKELPNVISEDKEDSGGFSLLPKPAPLRFTNLHQRYSITVPEKTTYTLLTENFEEIEFTACKLTPQRFIELGGALTDKSPGPSDCIERKTATIDLPDKKHEVHYFQLDIGDYFDDARGHYVLTFTHPDYNGVSYEKGAKKEYQKYSHIYTSVTNLSLVQKATNRIDLHHNNTRKIYETDLLDSGGEVANLYWAVDLRTMDVVEGADVFVYQRDTQNSTLGKGRDISIVANTKTDSDGIARTKVIPDIAGAYVVAGDDTAVVSGWSDSLNHAGVAREIERTYVYTDRPLYRPGHEVFIKGIQRLGYDGKYAIREQESIKVEVFDSRGNLITTSTSTLGDYGTFDIAVTLSENAPLGTYRIRAGSGQALFDVEEYARAPFEVKATSVQEEYISGDSMDVEINAQYFFGVGLPEGKVSYTITSQDYYFDRQGDYSFNFNGGAYQCYYCNTYDKFISRGTTDLKDGIARIAEKMDLEPMYDEGEDTRSKIYVVRAMVTDDRGKSVSAQTSFIVHKANYYAAVKSNQRFVEENSQVPVAIRTVNTKGVGVPVSDLSLAVRRKEWQKFKRQEVDGEFYYSWKEVEEVVYEDTVSTGLSGNASQFITYPKAGQYTIALSGVDDRGNRVHVSSYVYVYGDGAAPVRPSNDRTLELSVEKKDLDVGDRAKIIIQSPYPSAKALVGVERGTVMEYDVIDVTSSYFDYDFIVKDEHIPSVSFTVLLLSEEPEIKYGKIDFNINRLNKSLIMSVVSDKKTYIPGEEVVLDIRTADRGGRPVSSEVSLAAVDMSVLALKGNPTRDLLGFFYKTVPHEVITSSNLKYVHTEIEIPTGTKGGGGGDELEKKKRGVFKDTAFWDASVETNENGYAQVRFTLPDNLTRWRVESVAVTKDTKVGVHYLEFEERKRLMTIPSVPRFITAGDVFYVSAQVLNQSGSSQVARVSIESETLLPLGPASISKTLPDGANELVYFKVQAPHAIETGEHVVTIRAENNTLADIVEKKIPIVRNQVKEVFRLSDFSDGQSALEKVVTPTGIHEELGGITVSVHSTVGAFVEDALEYMAAFPYGCSEQLASKIDTLATIRKLLALENIGDDYDIGTFEHRGVTYTLDQAVANGLSKIYMAQNSDGGFGYYKRLKSDLGLTLHIVRTLNSLDQAGYEISESRFTRAIEFVEDSTKRYKGRGITTEASATLLEYTLSNVEPLRTIEPTIKHVKNGYLTIRDNLSRKTIRLISSSALARAAILSNDLGWWDRRTIWREIDRRLKRDKDGVYLGLNAHSISWGSYETSIKNTAQLLQAVMLQEKPHKETKNMLKWLLAQRYSDGAWGSTNATHAVVETIADYIVWKDEQNADYQLDVSINDLSMLAYEPKKAGALLGTSTVVSFEDLGLGESHDLVFEKEQNRATRDTFYYDIEMEYFLDREVLPARSEGIDVTRNFYKFSDIRRDTPVTEAQLGDVLVGVITFDFSKPSVLLGVEDIIPAGFEIINFDFSTEDKTLVDRLAQLEAEEERAQKPSVAEFMATQEYKDMEEVLVYRSEKFTPRVLKSVYARQYRPSFEELHDDRVFLFSERINPGRYKYEYYIRAQTPGVFQHMPATVSELYNPVFFGRTQNYFFTIHPKELR